MSTRVESVERIRAVVRHVYDYFISPYLRAHPNVAVVLARLPPSPSRVRGQWPLPELIMRSVCSASACFDIDIDCSARLAAHRFICEQWSIDCYRRVSPPVNVLIMFTLNVFELTISNIAKFNWFAVLLLYWNIYIFVAEKFHFTRWEGEVQNAESSRAWSQETKERRERYGPWVGGRRRQRGAHIAAQWSSITAREWTG